MTRKNRDIEVSERAKSLIDSHLGVRGRFAMLEKMSGISVGQWKNFYYGKQLINEQMLDFLVKKYPIEEIWMLTGNLPPQSEKFPFLAPVPRKSDTDSVGSRLNWVIREWAAPKGNLLFDYLHEVSSCGGKCKKIPAAEWAQVVLGLTEPTIEMITTVVGYRPHFAEWVLLGRATSGFQVDPSSQQSIAAWEARQQAEWVALEKSFHVAKQNGNKES